MLSAVIDASFSRTRTVLGALVFILIAGAYAFAVIPKESSPDVNIPIIYVSLSLEGISPGDSERLLLRPLEQELSSVEGVKEMRASAYQGGGFVLLEFQAGFDKTKAMDDVQKAVDLVRPDLPDSLESEPKVLEVNISLFPVLIVTLSGDVPERTLLKLANDLRENVRRIPAVLRVDIAGDREEQVEILIDPVTIESYGLDGVGLISFFQRSNRFIAAGNLEGETGRFAVEVPGLFESVRDLLAMPVRTDGDSTVLLGEIATIGRTFKDPQSLARLDGEKAVALEIVKRSGENIIDTIARVRLAVETQKQFWPESVRVTYSQDRSEDIKTMLGDLQNNVISAILLVMIVIVAALGWRSAGLVGVAIPGAFLAGILILYIMGLTVNMIVLFSLILSTGMLVDGAIVVTEYADRKMAEGLHRRDAYSAAAKRMAWPITASTATTLAAFAPLLFWPGVVGEFMKFLPVTLLAVLASSLAMALIFVPALGRLFGKAGVASNPEVMKRLAASEGGNLHEIGGLTGLYLRVLEKALRYPFRVLVLAFCVLVFSQMAYWRFGKGVEFFPSVEPEIAQILVHARGNLSIYEQDTLVREVEDRILGLTAPRDETPLRVEGIESLYVRVGKPAQQGGDLAEDVIGQIQIQFTEWDTRPPAVDILNEIRRRTEDLAGIHIETREMEDGPPTGKDVQIQLSSNHPERLPEAAARIRDALETLGGFRDIEDGLPLPGIGWELQVDRAQASKFELDIGTVGSYLRMVTNGLKVAGYRPDDSDDEIDIVLRYPPEKQGLGDLDHMRVTAPDGESIPVSHFTTRIPRPATGTIHRADAKRQITVQASVLPDLNVTAKVDEVKNWLAENAASFDPAIQITFKGEDEEQAAASRFLGSAFLVALSVMALILLTQFNSFYSMFLILSAVLMSTIGVMLGLLITGQPFGIIMSGIGVIALAGIIVNNNIVLIDTFDYIRRTRQCSVYEAILRTGAQRLRPVLLTTITTIIGLMPMALQINIDFVSRTISHGAPSTQWWVQLSTAIIFGLSFSTLLTLFVTPCGLLARAKASEGFSRLAGHMRGRFMAGKTGR